MTSVAGEKSERIEDAEPPQPVKSRRIHAPASKRNHMAAQYRDGDSTRLYSSGGGVKTESGTGVTVSIDTASKT